MTKRKTSTSKGTKRPAKQVSLRQSLRAAPKRKRPGRPCHLCSHPQLRQATADIAAGVPLRAIGRKYGCSAMAVSKYIRRHMGAALLQTDLTQSVLDQLRSLQRRTDRILAAAEEAEDLQTALRGVHEARENLMGIARLTGEDKSAQQREAVQINVVYVKRPLPDAKPVLDIDGGPGDEITQIAEGAGCNKIPVDSVTEGG